MTTVLRIVDGQSYVCFATTFRYVYRAKMRSLRSVDKSCSYRKPTRNIETRLYTCALVNFSANSQLLDQRTHQTPTNEADTLNAREEWPSH